MMIFKEAMTNCLKYAKADMVTFDLRVVGDSVRFELKDNGKGFELEGVDKGRGLNNMERRAAKIGAGFTMISNSGGTTIVLSKIPHMVDGGL